MINKLLEEGEKEFEDYFSEMYTLTQPEKDVFFAWHTSQQHKLLQSIVEEIDIAREEMKEEVGTGQWVGNWQNTPLINEADAYKVLDSLKAKLLKGKSK